MAAVAVAATLAASCAASGDPSSDTAPVGDADGEGAASDDLPAATDTADEDDRDDGQVTLAFAGPDGTLQGTVGDEETATETSVRFDGASLAVVTLRHESDPAASWARLHVNGIPPTDPFSGTRTPATVQHALVEDRGGEVPIRVQQEGLPLQDEHDGVPPAQWELEVAAAEDPARESLHGCWLYQAGEISYDGGTEWVVFGGGFLRLSDDAQHTVSDERMSGREGRYDYDSGVLRLSNDLGTQSYRVAVIDEGTPPVGGDATLLMESLDEDLRRTAVRIGDGTGPCTHDDHPPVDFDTGTPSDSFERQAVLGYRHVNSQPGEGSCTPQSPVLLEDRNHLDPDDPPEPAELYEDIPSSSGPQFHWGAPPVVTVDEELDQREAVKSLHKGAIVAYIDPDHPDREMVELWARTLGMFGFHSPLAGGVLLAAMPADATVDAPIIFTAWGERMVCDTFDPEDADAFVAAYYGNRGTAPEGELAPYPDDGLITFNS